jgi:hypothetical protein
MLIALSLGCKAQDSSKLWEDFKQASEKNTESVLPDFSYSGYKYSEEPIPYVSYKIFDVTKYGAIANDTLSDKKAIQKAIQEATTNGEGIIYFPKGKYFVNTSDDDQSIILIQSSKIVFRGEDRNQTILFFQNELPPADPNKLWTVPFSIKVATKKRGKFLTNIAKDARRESFTIQVENAIKIKKGDWITIKVLNNASDLVEKDLLPLKPDPSWKSIIDKGVQVNEHHQVAKVDANIIHLVEPIHYNIEAKHNWKVDAFEYLEHVGFENMTFEGNWTKDFIHHRSAQDDGGWSIIQMSRTINSWVKDVTFKNVSRALEFSVTAACTALNISIEGKIGHTAVDVAGSTGILIANSVDVAGMHHSFGVSGGSTTNTVIWRSKYPAHTSFEAHASQPRATLFDNVEGGFFQGRAGGARQNLPNHGRYLVLWNFKETDEAEENFRFIATDTWYWRIVPPIIVGFHGSGTTFKEDEVQVLESLGKPVKPESLFEEQLKLRLGKLPNWIENLKQKL